MKILACDIPEVLILEPRVFGDSRGYFFETWQQERYQSHGIGGAFVQDNLSYSRQGVLRGLHVQHPHAQGKLVQVLQGEVFDVAVDIRRGSPWFGRWVGARLSATNHRQFWVPPGFAHGFVVLSPEVLFSYKCTDYYHPETEFSIRWDDPAIGIAWPDLAEPPQLSAKDQAAPLLAELPLAQLPEYPNP